MIIRVGAGARCLGSIPSYPPPTDGPWENGENVVRLADMDPKVTPFRSGQSRNVGKWSFYDRGHAVSDSREVFHYRTLMGYFKNDNDGNGWVFVPVSTGWGSVSDQQGINKMVRGYGWYYVRANGARYEKVGS